MRRAIGLLIAGLLIAGGFSSCQTEQDSGLRIALSKASPNYINWLKRADSTIEVVDLYPMSIDAAMLALETCSGLVLTGGEDVYPGIYGTAADTLRCGDIDRHRDSLETAAIAKALDRGLPVAGICRGQQILNVWLGGTLFTDIPQDVGTKVIHRCDDYLSCFHTVVVAKGSLLDSIARADSGALTTNHHQAVRMLARGLKANAWSADSLIEGIEWADPANKPFMIGVQWHPERMDDASPLSGPLVRRFVAECRIRSAARR